jgi:hypothetical protein
MRNEMEVKRKMGLFDFLFSKKARAKAKAKSKPGKKSAGR